MSPVFHLVLVHGITGPGLNGSESQAKKFFSMKFPNAIIDEFDFLNKSSKEILGHEILRRRARIMLNQLMSSRTDSKIRDLPFVFLAHNLGGSLVKQALVIATEESSYQMIAINTAALIFYGTPHRAQDTLAWENQVFRLLSISDLGSMSSLEILQDLPRALDNLSDDFRMIPCVYEVINVLEEKGMGVSDALVVDHDSSVIDHQSNENIRLPCNHIELWRFVAGEPEIEALCRKIEYFIAAESQVIRTQLYGFLQELIHIDPETHRLRSSTAAAGLMTWISDHNAFKDWRDLASKGILRVCGPPSSGTTFITSQLLRMLLNLPASCKPIVVSFTFNKQYIQARTPASLFLSLSRQLLSYQPGLFRPMIKFCTTLAESKIFTEQTFYNLLCSLLKGSFGTSVVCIIHNTQECEIPLKPILGLLEKLTELSSGSLKLIVTGEGLHSCGNDSQSCGDICLSNDVSKASIIEQFVQVSVARLIADEPIWKDHEKTLIHQLCAMPTTYLLATRRMDLLQAPGLRLTNGAIKERVGQLSYTLEQTYKQTRSQVQDDNQNAAIDCALHWIIHALRPLKQGELAVAVALQGLKSTPSPSSSDSTALQYTIKRTVLNSNISSNIIKDLNLVFGPLIKVVDEKIYLLHQSFRDYLVRRSAGKHSKPTGHLTILSMCLDYLEVVFNIGLDPVKTESSLEVEFGLLNYATLYWPIHFQETNSDPAAISRVRQFMDNDKIIAAWSKLYQQQIETDVLGHETLDTPFKISCRFGFLGFVKEQVIKVKNEENSKANFQNALDLAARYGHEDTVKELLDNGAESDSALGLAVQGGFLGIIKQLPRRDTSIKTLDDYGYMPVHQAAARGFKEIVLTLLPDIRTSEDSTALHLAATTGQEAVVKFLVTVAKADPKSVNGSGYDALKLAAQSGFSEIVKFLLGRNGLVDKPAPDGNTALHLAVEFGHPITSQALLKAHENIACVNGSGLTPIHLAAREGHLLILKQLLESGVKPQPAETEDLGEVSSPVDTRFNLHDTCSPLQLAAQGGHLNIVRELLEYSADHSMDGCTAIFHAASKGHGSVVLALLNNKIDQVARDDHGNTALHAAAEGGYLDVVTMLLKWPQYDVNVVNDEKRTPLCEAAKVGNIDIVHNLIAEGAKVRWITDDGKTPLHISAENGHLLVVKELQRAQDTCQIQDIEGRTAFSLAIEKGHIAVVQELLPSYIEHKPDPEPELGNQHPFHLAVKHGHSNIVQLFLDNQWDISTRNSNQETLLHVASAGPLSIVESLLQAEATVDAEDEYGCTPLFTAAKNNNAEVAKALLAAKCNINHKAENDDTPLYQAAFSGSIKVVETLLSSTPSPDIDAKNHQGWTPVHAAYDNSVITKLLLDAGANVHAKDKDGITPLVLAARNGYENTFQVILKRIEETSVISGEDLSSAVFGAVRSGSLKMLKALADNDTPLLGENDDGDTVLHYAAMSGSKPILEYLIEKGAGIYLEKVSKYYGTPLITAASERSIDVIETLLDIGADVNATGGKYHSAIQMASWMGYEETVTLLLNKKADPNLTGGYFGNALIAAIHDGTKNVVELLLDAKADPNKRDQNQNTPLQIAATKGSAEIIELLLEKGVKANDSGGNHGSALNAAISKRKLDSVEMLLKHGANPNLQIPGQKFPIQLAVQRDSLPIIKALVKKGADLKVMDPDNRSILTSAIMWNSHSVIGHLLEQEKFDLDEKDIAGYTPLMAAVKQESSILKILLEKGADPDIKDASLSTPLIQAIILDYQSIVEILLKHDADPAILDARGRGALYWACRQGSIEIFEMIKKTLQGHQSYTSHCEAAIHAAVAIDRSDLLFELFKNKRVHGDTAAEDGWTPLYTAKCYALSSLQSKYFPRALETRIPIKKPSQWHSYDKAPTIQLSPHAKSVRIASAPTNPDNLWQPRGTIRTDYPMPGEGIYYFEVKITQSAKNKIIGVGFCEEHSPLNRMLGWDAGSWGYHGDDGKKFEDNASADYGDTFDTGDVIGCGVNFGKEIAFYTKNGMVIGRAFEDIRGKLYPAVCFDTTMEGAAIEATFWNDDPREFLFKGPYDGEATLKEPVIEAKKRE